jgi:multiple sugar transport system ATP-binding protein
LHQQFGTTVIYVTHDQVEAMTMADCIAVMSGGTVQQVGSPEEIYTHPSNMFVASFMGSPAMNFLDGTFTADNGAASVHGAGWSLPLSPANAARARSSSTGQLIVGARHANLLVLPESATDGLLARVYTVEPTGDLTFVHAYVGDQLLVASVPGIFHAATDQPIRLGFDQDHLYLFDAESKRAI